MLQLGAQAGQLSACTCRRWFRRFRSMTIQIRGSNGTSRTAGLRERRTMNSMSPLDRAQSNRTGHDSEVWFDSEACSGVRYRIARVSVSRRIDWRGRFGRSDGGWSFWKQATTPGKKSKRRCWQRKSTRRISSGDLRALRAMDRRRGRNPSSGHRKGPMALSMEILSARESRVRIKRERTKKLIVAFHFLRSDQAGWIASNADGKVWSGGDDAGFCRKRNGVRGERCGCGTGGWRRSVRNR